MGNQKHKLYYIGYAAIIALAYFIQFAPFMAPIFGAYPMPLLMVTVVLSMFENDLAAGIIGLACGILTDINTVNGSGFHAIIYMFAGVFISIMIETLLQNNFLSLMFIGTLTYLANSVAELLTKAKFTAGLLSLYVNFYLRSAILSLIFTIPLYLILSLIFGHVLHYKRPTGIIKSRLKKYRPSKKRIVHKKGF